MSSSSGICTSFYARGQIAFPALTSGQRCQLANPALRLPPHPLVHSLVRQRVGFLVAAAKGMPNLKPVQLPLQPPGFLPQRNQPRAFYLVKPLHLLDHCRPKDGATDAWDDLLEILEAHWRATG